MQAPQLRRPWMLGWAPQVPSSQLRGRGWWTVCASCSAAAGICCGLFLWQRSSGGGQPSRLRSPRGHHLLAPCAPPALSAACTVGRCCSLCASAGCRHSRSGASTGPRRLRPRCRPGRWGTGSLPLPQLAPSAAAGCCCPSQQSCSPPGVPQSAMTCPAKRAVPSGRVFLALRVGEQGEPKNAVGERWQGLARGLRVG